MRVFHPFILSSARKEEGVSLFYMQVELATLIDAKLLGFFLLFFLHGAKLPMHLRIHPHIVFGEGIAHKRPEYGRSDI